MKILFISRAFPPTIGGIENQNAGLAKHLPREAEVLTIANTRGKKFLPLFLPWVTMRALFLVRKFDAVLLGDGVLAPIGAFLSMVYPSKTFVSVIHGLDITYAKKSSFMGRVYRAINIPALKMLDRLIMVGNETIEQAVRAGIDRSRCVFIPNGLDPNALHRNIERNKLDELLGVSTTHKKVILRVGRYVRHKGVLWFLENVLPKLPDDFLFIAAGGVVSNQSAGDANIFPLCEKAIKKNKLEGRAILLKNISQQHLQILFNTCDLYVSPNIPVPGSLEGFGINLIEAASCGKTVLASNHEGLKDAVIEGKNGFLLPPENAPVWISKVQKFANDPKFLHDFGQSARRYTNEHFSWEKIARKYVEAMENRK